MRSIQLYFSDTHTNHLFGLCPPGMTVGGQTYQLNPPQKYLWYVWNECLDWFDKISVGCQQKYAFGIGDLVENDTKNRNRTELVSQVPSVALELAHKILEPVVNEFDYTFLIEGTWAHVGEEGWTEQVLARELGTVPDKKNKSYSWRHFIGEVPEGKIDVEHHPNGNSNIKRNYGAVAVRLAYDLTTAYALDWKEKLPALAVRSHLHRFADSGLNFPIRVIITPGLQLKSYYIRRMGKGGEMPQAGVVASIFEDGELVDVLPKIIKPEEKRNVWRVEKPKVVKSPPEVR